MQEPNREQGPQRPTQLADSVGPPFETSRLLQAEGFRHAFFTRQGGVSLPPFDSLNVAAASTGDSPANVAENVRLCARALGVPPSRLYFLSQVHGTDASVLDGSEDREDVARRSGDITASRAKDVACGVRSADCVTVLIADRKSGAVVAVHSGWRGTVVNAAAAGVCVLETLTDKPDMIAAIGPHIEACCFEVGDDVALELAKASTLGEAAVDRSKARAHVDLRRIVRAQLVTAGVSDKLIDDVRGCTVCDAKRFFSFRRDADKSGRMLSAIVPRV